MKNLGSEPAWGKINPPATSQGLVFQLLQTSFGEDAKFFTRDKIYEIDLAPY